METSIIIAGYAGQGVLFAGQVLACAGIGAGKHVIWTSSFMPGMHGGTAHCTVMMDDKPLDVCSVMEPTVAIVLNDTSFERYDLAVQPGGTLVVNSSMVNGRSVREDVDVVYVPANTLALAYGSIQMLNMAAVGALLARQQFLPVTAVEEALKHHLPCDRSELLAANLEVLHGGFRAATILASPPQLKVEQRVVG
jgi:2-oxoglutarate ferredoxin oxidoreductase subunit gamma